MRDLPDHQLEEDESSLDDLLAEQAEEDAWSDYLLDGDPVQLLEDYISEDQGEAFSLIRAYRAGNQAELTSAAYKMAVKLESLAEEYVR